MIEVVKLLDRLGIPARRKGRELWARCPSHDDISPSWSIDEQTGVHHCFGCGWGGTAADLVVLALPLASELAWTPADAWHWLQVQGFIGGQGEAALPLGVELYLQRKVEKAFRFPAQVIFGRPLEQWPTHARRYLLERRISPAQVRDWGIGFCVTGRLEGRIVFPVRDGAGKPLSYSARTFVGHDVRYLTPHESEGPDEAALFGEQFWTRDRRRCIVVEGAIKALTIDRVLSGNVAGLLGASRADGIKIVAKLATFDEVVVMTDPDEAGDIAAESLVVELKRHIRINRIRLDTPIDETEDQTIYDAVNGDV